MAITVNKDSIPERRMKNVIVYLGTFDCDNSYPTGGYDASLIQTRITRMHITNLNATYGLEYNPSTNKIMAFVLATGAEVSNGTSLSAVTGVPYEALVYFD